MSAQQGSILALLARAEALQHLPAARGLRCWNGKHNRFVAMWLGAMLLALQNPAKRRTRLQRLDGGLPLKTHRLRYGMHAAHHMCSRRGHAWGADKALQKAVLQAKS
jgi:hypothetical protein